MRLIWLEGKRIARRGWVRLCFVLFLALGIWISKLTLEGSFQKTGCSLEQYRETAESIRGMELTEAAEYLDEKAGTALETLETFQDWRMGWLDEEEASLQLAALGLAKVRLEDMTFEELRADRVRYQAVKEEVWNLLQYEDRIREIWQGGGGLSGISFFREDDYVARAREKAARDYAGLSVKLERWQPNLSAQAFLQNRVMDGLIFLFLAAVVLQLYMEEKEKGYLPLTAAARGGRGSFYCKKAAVLLGFALITTAVYEGALLLYHIWQLGGVDWEAPLQSIAAFEMCSRPVTVGGAIVLTVLLKACAFYIVALLLAALACMIPRSMPFLGTVTVLALLALFWNQTADLNGRMGWLCCLNPVRMTDGAGLIGQYRQFPVLQRPVSQLWLTAVFGVGIAVLSYGAGACFYGKIRRSRRRKFSPRRRSEGAIANAFARELYKVMISYRMLVPFLLVVLACAAVYVGSEGRILTQQERFYREYMVRLNGPLTGEKEQMLLEERERFRSLEALRDELLAHGENQELLLNYIANELIKRDAFQRAEQQYERVREQGGVFLYETGFLYLLGVEENKPGRRAVFFGILLLTLLLPALSWIELGGGADGLVRTTARGRGRLLWVQYGVSFTAAVVLLGCVCGEDTAKTFEQFGSWGLTQTAGNISRLEGFLSGCSLWLLLAIIWFVRLLGCGAAALFAMACMYRCRDYLSTVFLFGGFLAVPYVLFMQGFSFMRGYFLNALLSGEEFLSLIRQGRGGTIVLLFLQLGVCVVWSLGILRKEVKRR